MEAAQVVNSPAQFHELLEPIDVDLKRLNVAYKVLGMSVSP
jgi:hypothetical protein